MDKLKLSDLLAAKFQECLKSGEGFKPVYYPHIPDAKISKAEKNFVKYKDNNETMIMLYDTSLFERGKNGMAFTDKAVYFKDMIGDSRVCRYSDWRRDKDDLGKIFEISEGNAFFLIPFLNNLMNEISIMLEYEVETEGETSVETEAEAVTEELKGALEESEEKSKEEDSDDDDEEDDSNEEESDDEESDDEAKDKSGKRKKGGSGSSLEALLGVADILMDVFEDPT
ncbi:hypothetical protein SAMN02910369_01667 [Lachnospiraceae bacterium NE2001]|nr:hypothetical protein SAMN02910369_01667 [Lachnospiraceae bacterium NE2001]